MAWEGSPTHWGALRKYVSISTQTTHTYSNRNAVTLLNFLFANSQPEQIQAEFKVLALQYHPDKNSGDKEAEVKFQKMKVNQQYYHLFPRPGHRMLSRNGQFIF